MPICGCWLAVISDRGGFGFSNDRSLMYCATTLSCGCVSSAGASAGPPLVVLMKSPVFNYLSSSVLPRGGARLANTGSRGEQGLQPLTVRAHPRADRAIADRARGAIARAADRRRRR